MPKVNIMILLVSLLCVCGGCAQSSTSPPNAKTGTKMKSSESRLADLLSQELRHATATYTLPNIATLDIESTEVSETEVRAELAQKMEILKVSLVDDEKESHIAIKVDKVKLSDNAVSAQFSIKWGPRKGYLVDIEDIGGEIRRNVTAQF